MVVPGPPLSHSGPMFRGIPPEPHLSLFPGPRLTDEGHKFGNGQDYGDFQAIRCLKRLRTHGPHQPHIEPKPGTGEPTPVEGEPEVNRGSITHYRDGFFHDPPLARLRHSRE